MKNKKQHGILLSSLGATAVTHSQSLMSPADSSVHPTWQQSINCGWL